MKFYSLSIDLRQQKCIVVGGGKVALRKVKKLCEAEAIVSVVALEFLPEFYNNPDLSNVTLIQSAYQTQLIKDAVLVFAATSNFDVNQQICSDAKRMDIWVNSVNGAEYGSFIIPATCSKGALNIGITTQGKAPVLSKYLRRFIQEKLSNVEETLIEEIITLRQLKVTSENNNTTDIEQTITERVDEFINQFKI